MIRFVLPAPAYRLDIDSVQSCTRSKTRERAPLLTFSRKISLNMTLLSKKIFTTLKNDPIYGFLHSSFYPPLPNVSFKNIQSALLLLTIHNIKQKEKLSTPFLRQYCIAEQLCCMHGLAWWGGLRLVMGYRREISTDWLCKGLSTKPLLFDDSCCVPSSMPLRSMSLGCLCHTPDDPSTAAH